MHAMIRTMVSVMLPVAVAICLAGVAFADDDEPTPLDRELFRVNGMRAGEDTPYDKVEAECQRLLKDYKQPEEHGRIYFTLVHVYVQSGADQPEQLATCVQWAKKATEFPLDPENQQLAYVYWGDALQMLAQKKRIGRSDEGWPAARREAVMPYLRGLKALLKYDLPERPSEPDAVGSVLVDGPPNDPEVQKLVREQKNRMEVLRQTRFQNDMIRYRDMQTGQIAGLYFKQPFGDELDSLDELETLAKDVLQDDKAVARLLAAVKAREQERAKKRTTSEPTTQPAPGGKK